MNQTVDLNECSMEGGIEAMKSFFDAPPLLKPRWTELGENSLCLELPGDGWIYFFTRKQYMKFDFFMKTSFKGGYPDMGARIGYKNNGSGWEIKSES